MKKKQTIEWYCHECGSLNVDTYGETLFPICGECGEEHEWDEILEPFIETAFDEELRKVGL